MSDKNSTVSKLTFTAGLVAVVLTVLHLIFLLLTFSGRLRFRAIFPHLKTMTIVILGLSLVLAVLAIVFGIIYRRKEKSKLASWGLWLGVIWMAFPIILGVSSLKIVQIFKDYKKSPEGLTVEEQVVQDCISNQEQLELIANEFWRKDHPDSSEEDIKNLDLGPKGDLLGMKKGGRFIYYTGDFGIFNCPEDEDMEDVDYAVDKVDKDGYIHIKCIHNEMHNK